jgi:hypothetical protein
MPATFPDSSGHRWETGYELNLLAEYFRISEAAIPAAEATAKNLLDEAISLFENENDIFLHAFQAMDQAQRYRREFPLRLRYGYLIQLYTLFEERARSLSKVIPLRDKLSHRNFKDKQNLGFVLLFRDWITDNTSGTSERWDFVDKMRIIRNCIVHANGRIDGDNDPNRLRTIIHQIDEVDEDECNFISLSSSYCKEAHTQIQGLFEDLYKSAKIGMAIPLTAPRTSNFGVIIDQNGEFPTFSVPKFE